MALSTSQHSSPVRDVAVQMAESDADIEAFRRHSKKYAQWISGNFAGVCEHQQSSSAHRSEMASLPAPYTPGGFILYAGIDNEVVGAVSAKPQPEAHGVGNANVIELKWMFVRDDFRGCGVGRAMVRACVEGTRTLGYMLIVLDTNTLFVSANALCPSCGITRRDFYLPGLEKTSKGEMLAYETSLHLAAEVVVRRAESDTDIEAFKNTAKKPMRNGCGKKSRTEQMCPSYSKRRYMFVRCRSNDDE